jgi:hypothetical protein
LGAFLLAQKQQQQVVPLRQLPFGVNGREEGLLEDEEDGVNDDVVSEK